MRLSDRNTSGSPRYECDRCRIAGEITTFIIEEDGRHFCFSCWYEGEQAQRPLRWESIVES